MNKLFLAAIVIFSNLSYALPARAVLPGKDIVTGNEVLSIGNPEFSEKKVIVTISENNINEQLIKRIHDRSSGEIIIVQKIEERPERPRREDDDFARSAQIQSFMLGKIIGFLSLSEDQVKNFTPVFKQYSKEREQIIRERRRLMKYITQNVDKPAVPVKDLETNVFKLRKTNESLTKERDEFLKNSKKYLNERQYVKLVIFDDWLKEDYFRHMRDGERPTEPK